MQLSHFMTSYRITKYDPEKRNAQGHYLDDSEWTSIADIGKSAYNNPDYAAYEKTETAYVDAIKIILHDLNLDHLKIKLLELNITKEEFEEEETTGKLKNINVDFDRDIRKLENGFELDFENIEKIIRLILREMIWMVLINENIEIRFGYDYYMYVSTVNLKPSTISKIENNGLYVEPYFE